MARLDFGTTTKSKIKTAAGNLCCNPACLTPLVAANVNVGDVAHIFDAAESEPIRGRGGLSDEQLISPSNGLLLCKKCHGVADNKTSPTPASTLKKWKLIRESAAFHTVANHKLALCLSVIGAEFINQQFNLLIESGCQIDSDSFAMSEADLDSIVKTCFAEYARVLSNRSLTAQMPQPPSDFKLARRYPVNSDELFSTLDFEVNLHGISALIESWLPKLVTTENASAGCRVIKTVTSGYIAQSDFDNKNYEKITPTQGTTIIHSLPRQATGQIFKHLILNSLINSETTISRVGGRLELATRMVHTGRVTMQLITGMFSPIIEASPLLPSWDHLMSAIENGDDLLLVFPKDVDTAYSEVFPVEIDPHYFSVRLPTPPRKTINKARTYLNRALTIVELIDSWRAKGGQFRSAVWHYSVDCFSFDYETSELRKAMERLMISVADDFKSRESIDIICKLGMRRTYTLTYDYGYLSLGHQSFRY